jgi:hypothetical protein
VKHFKYSFIVAFIALTAITIWGYTQDSALKILGITLILAIMEISFSFDNAVLNATILKTWNRYWQMMFLSIGMIIAVFGMRLLFPILIVSQTSDMSVSKTWDLALNNPISYSAHLSAHHAEISAFGGVFLLLVFLNFLFDEDKKVHWFEYMEKEISELGKIDAISVLITLLAILFMLSFIDDPAKKFSVLVSAIWGIIVYLGVRFIGMLLEHYQEKQSLKQAVATMSKGSFGGFLYLEVLDASFSFDGVIGSFAITKDIVVIMVGLGIGACFVRSMTIYLVEKGTLDEYIYLEHGAHYAIGALAIIMLIGIVGVEVPEIITGLIGVIFIAVALYGSIRAKKGG